MESIELGPQDALLIVDVQNDFLPGGSLAVSGGDAVIPVLNRVIEVFQTRALPIFATRDWHPANHCSFNSQGGLWPPHCVAGSWGASLAPELRLPQNAMIISKATSPHADAYSGFEGTGLASTLRAQNIKRIFVGGLATDYCVLNTVLDGLAEGFQVVLLIDAIRPVEVHAGDGQAAIGKMIEHGAVPLQNANVR